MSIMNFITLVKAGITPVLGVCFTILLLVGCGSNSGDNKKHPTVNPPVISEVKSSALSDTDSVYSTGKVVRIDVKASGSSNIVTGTIRITSASQGYDSGFKPLKFGSIFYEWDTTGLNPANDYVVQVSLTDANNQTMQNNSLEVTLISNPPAISKLVSDVDINVPARGFPIRVVRTYLLDSTFDGPLGYGWTHTYRMRAVETPTNNINSSGQLVPVDGIVQIFNADGTGSYFQPNGDGTYQSPKGDFRTLKKNSTGIYTLKEKSGTRYDFDTIGRLTLITDRNGNALILKYGSNGRMATVTDASGQVTTFTYNSANRISSITDPVGQAVSYGYDNSGNLISVTGKGDFVTTYTYDSNHNLTTITDPAGRKTFFTADAEDRLASVSGAGGENKLVFKYGVPAPDKMTVTDALGNQTIMTYDNNALITRIVDPLGNTSNLTYDADLNLIGTIDPTGGQNTFTYDSRGNVLSTTYAQGNIVTVAYEPVHNQAASLTDAKGNTTTFSYDAKGNLITMTYPNGSAETFAYDAGGDLISRTDRKGQTITFDYDTAGRLAKKSFPDGTFDTFNYDVVGNLTGATDENGTISFSYDSSDRVTNVNYPGGESISYAYDSAGNRTQLIYPNGMVLDYSYDSLGRLMEITESGQTIAKYTYDALSRVVRRDLQNGTFSTYTYDDSSRLLDLINSKSTSEIISRFTYTYDNVGNRVSVTTLEGTTQYIYDQINQLTHVVLPSGSTTNYNFDQSGNRTSVVQGGNAVNYTTNNLNQYADINGDTYTYDANGNMTSKTTNEGVTTYVYYYENRLVQVVTPANIVSFVYDPLGRHISKTTLSGTTKYIHDGVRVIQEEDESGTTLASYIHGIGLDEVLIMKRTGQDYYYSQDGLGSVTDLTDLSEDVVDSFTYDAYGLPSNLSTVGNPYLYTGREYESEIDMYFYRSRYYNHETGRFITTDPIGFAGGNNLYNYVSNNPINSVDPFGLFLRDSDIVIQYLLDGTAEMVSYTLGEFQKLGFQLLKIHEKLGLVSAGEVTLVSNLNLIVSGVNYALLVKNIIQIGINNNEIDLLIRELNDIETQIRVIQNRRSGSGGGDGSECVEIGDCDGDGVADTHDPQSNNPDSPYPRDREGCERNALGCTDRDRDGTPDYQDPQPDNPDSPHPRDREGCEQNALGCTDVDDDGIPDYKDPCICTGDPTFIQKKSKEYSTINLFQNVPKSSSVSAGLFATISMPHKNVLVRGEVPIFGSAYGENFKEYKVEYGKGSTPTEWVTITSSTTPKTMEVTLGNWNNSGDTTIHGNLATWDTGLKTYVYLPTHPKDHPIDLKGTYTIRLVVTGKDGATIEDRVTVNVADVIPNAWGGVAKSKDGNVQLIVPEQALMDSFRLIGIQAIDNPSVLLPENRTLLGNLYQVREAGERFTKKSKLMMTYSPALLGENQADRLGIYGYNADAKRWEHIDSTRMSKEDVVYTQIQKLHSYYALMFSDLPEEGSKLETDEPATAAKISVERNNGDYLVRNTFENDMDEWSNRDGEVGGEVSLDDSVTSDGTRVLRITNPRTGGNFAVNVRTTPFDVQKYPVVQFDYRIQAGVKTNLLVRVNGRWYEIGFTDDPKELHDKRVNIAHIGDIQGIITDDLWHTAQFNLFNMLRTKTGHTVVEQMIMADWDVGGYMKLQFGKNSKGATYYIDNLTISRETSPGLRIGENIIQVDHFNEKKDTNALGGAVTTYQSVGGSVRPDFSNEDATGKGYSQSLSYDVSQKESYAGYITHLQNLDLRGYQALTFYVKGKEDDQDSMVGIKDIAGHEAKVSVRHYLLSKKITPYWQKIEIPLSAFSGEIDWGRIENLSLSFENNLHDKGTLFIDHIEFHKEIKSFLVDDFERSDKRNAMGRTHWTQVSGNAAINSQHAKGSPNGIYRISYGGNIGNVNAYASDQKSFAGWTTDLGGIDCSQCGTFSFRIRGAEGGENATLYLDDGNFRWGVELAKITLVTTSWENVTIPLNEFAEYGIDLTHLSELQLVFEGVKMSGTIYLDDIRFGKTDR